MFDALKYILSGQHQLASEGLLLMIVGGLGVSSSFTVIIPRECGKGS